MLNILKIENWEQIPPLKFYLEPLHIAVDEVRKCLIDMNNLGPLRCKYIVEHNEELLKRVKHMVKMDLTA